MADKTLTCKDCGAEFVFTEGEQQFYARFHKWASKMPRMQKARKAQKKKRNNFNN